MKIRRLFFLKIFMVSKLVLYKNPSLHSYLSSMIKYNMATGTNSSISEVSSHSDQASTLPNSGNSGTPENITLLISSHKLNGQNFLQWSQSVRMFICGRGKEDYLTGEIPIPKKDDPGHKKWKAENLQIRS